MSAREGGPGEDGGGQGSCWAGPVPACRCAALGQAASNDGWREAHPALKSQPGVCSFVMGVVSCYPRGAAGGTSRLGGVLWVLGEALAAPAPE